MRLTIACLLVSATAYGADPSPAEVLGKVDAALNAFKDGTFESKLFVKQPDGKAREYSFITYQKNPDKRLVRFLAPGDVKGMGFLVENKETMYAYLPGFQKIRRLGTHVKNQTFMGSDVGFDDMSQTSFSNTYDAKSLTADGDKWVIELQQKSGMDLEYPKMKLTVHKDKLWVGKIEYLDASGKKLKTQERLDYRQDGPTHWQPGKIVFTDHRRNDHTSEIVFGTTKTDTGLSDDLFTQRSLMRGN
jgi:outer membrane lipoprotein-sorting protein